MNIVSIDHTVSTNESFELHDLTGKVRELIQTHRISSGLVTICSFHTTTAITINENEKRLMTDIKTFFEALVPKNDHYLHNDIDLRDCPPEEPENAHSHIMAMLFGASESIPVVDGKLALGQWQSVFLVELDGPRQRTVKIQIIGQ